MIEKVSNQVNEKTRGGGNKWKNNLLIVGSVLTLFMSSGVYAKADSVSSLEQENIRTEKESAFTELQVEKADEKLLIQRRLVSDLLKQIDHVSEIDGRLEELQNRGDVKKGGKILKQSLSNSNPEKQTQIVRTFWELGHLLEELDGVKNDVKKLEKFLPDFNKRHKIIMEKIKKFKEEKN